LSCLAFARAAAVFAGVFAAAVFAGVFAMVPFFVGVLDLRGVLSVGDTAVG
jgi:hypothetical protein